MRDFDAAKRMLDTITEQYGRIDVLVNNNGECAVIHSGEWLRGAGQFSYLDTLSHKRWDALTKLSKRAK